MKVTITGNSGFVAKNLIKYLKSYHEINSLSIRYRFNQTFGFNSEAVIHLAGLSSHLKKVSDPCEYYEANRELTKQLFDYFLNSEASVFIFMSTVKAVADSVAGILTEESIPNPKTHYGIAKHQAEEYILSKSLPMGKRVYILRPCMIHGPGNKGNLNLLYQLVSKGLPWPLGSFKNQRSFLSIENLCFVIKELLENDEIPSGIYQVADNEPVSTNDLIQIIAQSLDTKNWVLNIPASSIKMIARLGDYLHLPLNTECLQKLTENYVVSNHKIIKVMGKELPISTEEGLLKTFQSFRHAQ
ncbi:MAG: NAD-dependent epimerase/dehydratase family protein [Flavobacterium sp.]|nr:NAD-dependent epimerase/dehydratase family protein [Flavobacterium sp.]